MEKSIIKGFLERWHNEHAEEFYEAALKIWQTPELSMQEYKSSKVLTDLLTRYGFTVEIGVAGMPTAFIATYGEGKPVIAINAEYDALPGLSQKAGVLQKQPIIDGAPGHGCGHNLLGTGGVKAGIAIKSAMEEYGLKGTIKIVGTPGEELCLGKPYLGKAGYFDGIDAFLDWHPWSYNKADYDSCCAYFNVKYHFKGRTSHGNSPWHGRSSLDAAILQSHAVEMLREHIYPGSPPDAANTINFTFSAVGPEFPSVVPDKTTAWYVGRFITTDEAIDALRRVTNCAKGAALATETEVETELITMSHHKIPNKVLAEVVHNNFQQIGPPKFTEEEQQLVRKLQEQIGVAQTGLATSILPFSGGHTVVCDTSEYSWNAPYASLWVAMGPENAGWHHWGVALCAAGSMGRKSMDIAAKVISASAIDLLEEPGLIRRAQEELSERLNGETYKCLLPDNYTPPVHLNEDTMKKYFK